MEFIVKSAVNDVKNAFTKFDADESGAGHWAIGCHKAGPQQRLPVTKEGFGKPL